MLSPSVKLGQRHWTHGTKSAYADKCLACAFCLEEGTEQEDLATSALGRGSCMAVAKEKPQKKPKKKQSLGLTNDFCWVLGY